MVVVNNVLFVADVVDMLAVRKLYLAVKMKSQTGNETVVRPSVYTFNYPSDSFSLFLAKLYRDRRGGLGALVGRRGVKSHASRYLLARAADKTYRARERNDE